MEGSSLVCSLPQVSKWRASSTPFNWITPRGHYAKKLMHGKQSNVRFDADCLLFKGCPEVAPVARYHSLAADADTIPEYLKITALTTEGEVMAAQHKDYPIYGVQFHPESIMTPDGKQMLRNFIKEI